MSEEVKEIESETSDGKVETEEIKEEESDEEVEYVCPPEFNEREEMCKMFVGGLDKDTKDEEFKALFSTFGEIADFIIIRKDNQKSDRLFGFITFSKCDDLEECLLARPHKYKERELDIKRAVPRNQDDGTGHLKVKKLHIANVPTAFDIKALKKYLKARHPKKYGSIEEVNLLKSKDDSGNATGKNRGFGFITVSSEDFADRISIAENKFTLEGVNMRINKAKPKGGEGAQRGGFRGGRKQGYNQGHQGGGWDDWSYGGYGGGYGYGYPPYGYGYDYYSYPPYPPYGAHGRSGRGGGGRFAPY